MKPHLVSFKLCPFVQRSVIVLREKGVDFDITYINLQDPPGWFKEISPFGKVPVLRVGDAVIFESAVIMEYLDEVNPPSLHPADPVQKAVNRAWFEFASNLFVGLYKMVNAREETEFAQHRDGLRNDLARLEQQIVGPHFNGEPFCMVDAAFAPFFVRAALLERCSPELRLMDGLPKISAWRDALLARPSVRTSTVEDFAELYNNHVASCGSHAAKLVQAAPV